MKKSIQLILFVILFQGTSFAQYTLTSTDVTIDDSGYITDCIKTFGAGEKDLIIPDSIDGKTINGVIDKSSFTSGVFYGKGLTSVKFPAGFKIIGKGAFGNNTITKIDLSKCTSLKKIDDFAFYYCSLESVDFSNCDSLEYIGWSAFYQNNLISLDLSSCTLLKTIYLFAFADNDISEVKLPNSITTLAEACFNNNKITSINGKPSNGLFYALNTDGSWDSTVVISYGGASDIIDFIPEKVVEFAPDAFYRVNISTLDLSKNKLLTTVGDLCFQFSTIDSVDFTQCPLLNFVGDDAFNQTGVTSFYLPVTNQLGYEFMGWKNENGVVLTLTGNFYLANNVRSSYTATFNALGNKLTFVVKERSKFIEGANVDLKGYGQLTTNENGVAEYPSVLEGNCDYTVSASNYLTYNGTLSMGSTALTENIALTSKNTVDIELSELNLQVKIWPNPASEKIYINSNEQLNTIELLNLQGVLVKILEPTSTSAEIDLAALEPGFLILKCTNKNGVSSIHSILKK